MAVGSKITIGLLRDGKPLNVDVTLQQSSQPAQVASATVYTGIEGAELSNSDVNGQKGVKVDNVKPGSTAARVQVEKRRYYPRR